MVKTRDSGALLLIISTLMVKILGVLYKVPLTYILTEEGMGYFNTAYTVYGFFYILCSTGIPKAVTMQVSSQIEGENKTQIFHLYNKGFTFVSVILLGLFILLAKPVSLILGVSGAYYSLLSISPAVFFAAISSLYRGYLVGVGKVGGIAVASFIEALCKFIFGLLFAQIGVSLNISLFSISAFTVLGISIGGFLSTLIMYICCKTSIKRDNQGQKVSIDAKETIYDLIKIALPITLSSLAINLGGLLDLPILISGLSRYITNEGEIVALYGNYSTLGLPMFNLIISLTSPLALTLLPKLCTTITEGKADYNKLIKNTTNLSMLLTAMSVAVFYFFSFDILDILFSSQASVNGYRTLIYLSLSLLFFVPLTITNTIHESQRRLSAPIISLIIGSAVKLIFGYVLCSNPYFSVCGLALSNIISYGVSLLISIIMLRDKKIIVLDILGSLRFVIEAFLVYGIFFKYLYSTGKLGQGILSFVLLIALSSICYLLLVGIIEYFLHNIYIYRQNTQKSKL